MPRSLPQTLRLIDERCVENSNGCIEWPGQLQRGYGYVRCEGVMAYTHRLIYADRVGPIVDGLWVLHTCDNRACNNPAHLYLGTYKQNIEDKCIRDRSGKKLSIAAVIKIKALVAAGASQNKLAKEYGVNQSNISRAVRGKRWAHVTHPGGVPFPG